MLPAASLSLSLPLQDVYEIKGGNDWQDSLNEAIASCSVFIPLVSSNYGETLWTNREVSVHLFFIVLLSCLRAGCFLIFFCWKAALVGGCSGL